jgi:hypothetical protein
MSLGVLWPEPNGSTKLLYHLENENDSSGNGKTLTNHGASFVNGLMGVGADLVTSGTNYLSRDSDTGVNTSGPLTVMWSFRLTDLPAAGMRFYFTHLENSGGLIHDAYLENISGVYTLYYAISGVVIIGKAITLTTGRKHCIAITTDGSNARKLYYDGAQIAAG